MNNPYNHINSLVHSYPSLERCKNDIVQAYE